jgi:hypothetical protein
MRVYMPFCLDFPYLRTKNEVFRGDTYKILDVHHQNPASPLGSQKKPEGPQWRWNQQCFAMSRRGVEESVT